MSNAPRQRPELHRIGVATAPSAGARYDVLVGAGLLGELGERVRGVWPARYDGPSRALLVHDAALPRELVNRVQGSLAGAGWTVSTFAARASEELKSFETVGAIVAACIEARLERAEPMVALGGGVIGDVAGFAAACYRRGVPVVQCPTTLLSMVDASVGGKTGVNVRAGGVLKKNMAGAFHQPALVVCDVEALASLPARELRSGLAECIKHALIAADFGDAGLLEFTRGAMARGFALDPSALIELVSRNVAVKAACVSGDEREIVATDAPHGGRMALNAGHTVGHAIETLPGLSHGSPATVGLTHGEAVGLGLLAEARLAAGLGLLEHPAVDGLVGMLAAAGLPTIVSGLPGADRVIELMADDKKVSGGRVRMSLPASGCRCRLVENPPRDVLAASIDSLRA